MQSLPDAFGAHTQKKVSTCTHASLPRAGDLSPPDKFQLVSQIQQLRELIFALGPALYTVTSLEMTLNFTVSYGVREKTDHGRCGSSSCNFGVTPGEASPTAILASLLVDACPNVCKLGLGGGVGEEVMRWVVTIS